jgi:MFS family permease
MSIKEAEPTSQKVSLYPILMVNFIGTLGFSIILPFLVFLVTKFEGNALIYGIMGATYPAFQLIGAPILGKWSDIYGRKRILFLSQFGTLISWVIFLFALLLPINTLFEFDSTTYGKIVITLPIAILFLARALDGLTGGNVSVANAYLADITEEKKRNANFGKMSISSNLGFIVGPALAGVLGGTILKETLPVLAALFISLVATLLIAFRLPESRPCVLKKPPEKANVRKVFGQEHKECYKLHSTEEIGISDLFKIESIPFLMLLYFLIFLGFNFFYTAFPIHAVKGLGWTVTSTGIFFSVLSLMMVFVQGPVLVRASKRWSDGVLIFAGSIILGINFILLLSQNTVMIYLAAAFFALGNGLMWPSFLSVLSKTAGEKYQGSVQGFANSFGSAASIIGLILGGVLYGFLGERTFLISAIVLFVVFILSFRLIRKVR